MKKALVRAPFFVASTMLCLFEAKRFLPEDVLSCPRIFQNMVFFPSGSLATSFRPYQDDSTKFHPLFRCDLIGTKFNQHDRTVPVRSQSFFLPLSALLLFPEQSGPEERLRLLF